MKPKKKKILNSLIINRCNLLIIVNEEKLVFIKMHLQMAW